MAERSKIIRENHLDFLFDLHLQGVEIGSANVDLLKKNQYIESIVHKEIKKAIIADKINQSLLGISNQKNKEADSRIDIVESEGGYDAAFEIITDQDLEQRRQTYGHKFEGRKTEIERHEWLPESRTEHAKDFVEWINSINSLGFHNKRPYKKFALYCQQAYTWLQENKTPSDFEDDDEREEYRMNELKRCDHNSLYFLNKYIYYKEGDDETGRVKYTAWPAHEVMSYLDDCGYSVAIAKGRQMAATTTLMALDVKDVIFKTNHFMKFITEDKDKAEEIFEDKLKFAFSELPDWMRPNVLNERDNLFKIGYKQEKGKKEGVGSKIELAAAKRTAIAGGAPQKVKIDEAGNISILSAMINNARPTMLFHDHKKKKIIIKRQLWFWGTGGEMDKGGKAFETEFMSLLTQWQQGDYSSAIIPIFFDWRCRPGATQENYDNEKRVAYSKEGTPEGKKAITEFHQSWPDSLSDVFRTSAKTLVDDDYIESSLKRIREARRDIKFRLYQHGYFEPVYDTTKPAAEGSDVPYQIIDANFIPTDDLDARASVTIFSHPKDNWKNRYFQGTDPISTNTGLSNMASTVWDKYYKCPAAIVNWRIADYYQVFLQCLLMNLYYDRSPEKKGIHELVESNTGSSYCQYVESKGHGKNFVLNYQLPHAFQNKTTINEGVGIDNKGIRNNMIINRLFELVSAYGDNIYHDIIFEQLKTFTCNISEKGTKEVWGPTNRKYFKDDTLFSTAFAYICGELCFPELIPVDNSKEKQKVKIRYELRRDKDYNLIRVPVKRVA